MIAFWTTARDSRGGPVTARAITERTCRIPAVCGPPPASQNRQFSETESKTLKTEDYAQVRRHTLQRRWHAISVDVIHMILLRELGCCWRETRGNTRF